VLDLGIDKVIFVKEREILTPRKVTTGARSGNLIEVKTGLASSEEIAANAQYIVDSESLIKINE
jgi:Cu(I)/Ag(I) efflux system membrane fusion protein